MELGTYTNRTGSDWNPALYSNDAVMNWKWTVPFRGGKSRRKRKGKTRRRIKPILHHEYLHPNF